MSSGKPLKFTNWGHGQPDNFSHMNNEIEQCIQIFSSGKWGQHQAQKWNDARCSDEVYFICEQDVIQYDYCES